MQQKEQALVVKDERLQHLLGPYHSSLAEISMNMLPN
jgi:hypothetical protein